MSRLAEQHSVERGTLDAELSRLRAENEILSAEGVELLLKVRSAEVSRHESDTLGLSVGTGASYSEDGKEVVASPAISAAEKWVLEHAARPLDAIVSVTYAGRTHVTFDNFDAPRSANAKHRDRTAVAVASGDAARLALQAYRVHDRSKRGYLEIYEIADFVMAVFQQLDLSPPTDLQVQSMLSKFCEEDPAAECLDACSCICLTDALLRATFSDSLPREVPSRMCSRSETPQQHGCRPSQRGSVTMSSSQVKAGTKLQPGFEQRLRMRLDDVEKAAEKALSHAMTGVPRPIKA